MGNDVTDERQPELGRIADALCEYNERDAQDAARYRWLRQHGAGKLRGIVQPLAYLLRLEGTGYALKVSHSEIQAMLDEEIDNAMGLTPNANVCGLPQPEGD